MKNVGTLAILAMVALYLFKSPIFDEVLGMSVRVIHFLLLFYLLWILLYDFLKSLRKKMGEKFGFQIKNIKRKLYKLKH